MKPEWITYIIVLHWIADFVCQDDWTAINKSKSWLVLTFHCSIYFFVLLTGLAIFGKYGSWVWINFPAHFIIDGITSRINAYLYKKEMRHWFFVMIGFDQVLHYVVLFLTIQ